LADTHHSPPARSLANSRLERQQPSRLQLVYLVYLVGLVCGAEDKKSGTGATLGYKAPMQCLDDWLMAQQYENW